MILKFEKIIISEMMSHVCKVALHSHATLAKYGRALKLAAGEHYGTHFFAQRKNISSSSTHTPWRVKKDDKSHGL